MQQKIPVIAAGGIFTAEDITEVIEAGAEGVQIGTRFVVTEECDASPEFKQAYIDSKEEDIKIAERLDVKVAPGRYKVIHYYDTAPDIKGISLFKYSTLERIGDIK